MSFSVLVDKKELDRFRKEAIKYYKQDKEYMEMIFVEHKIVGKQDHFIIKEFRQLKLTATISTVAFTSSKEFVKYWEEANNLGYEVATIHTHPDQEASPSIKDIKSDVASELVLTGICSLFKDKYNRVRASFEFWRPQSPGTIYDLKYNSKKQTTRKKSSNK